MHQVHSVALGTLGSPPYHWGMFFGEVQSFNAQMHGPSDSKLFGGHFCSTIAP
jgi:hypothetical protein